MLAPRNRRRDEGRARLLWRLLDRDGLAFVDHAREDSLVPAISKVGVQSIACGVTVREDVLQLVVVLGLLVPVVGWTRVALSAKFVGMQASKTHSRKEWKGCASRNQQDNFCQAVRHPS